MMLQTAINEKVPIHDHQTSPLNNNLQNPHQILHTINRFPSNKTTFYIGKLEQQYVGGGGEAANCGEEEEVR